MRRGMALLLTLVLLAPFLYMLWGARFAASLPAGLGFWLANSVVIAVLAASSQVFTSAAAAYAFARLRFPARGTLFGAMIALLLVPGIMLLFPRLTIVTALGAANTHAGLVSTGLVSAWGILLLHHVFRRLPHDVEDAARLDGAGEWTILWRIVVPRATPALIAVAALAFVDQWKNLIWPLVVAPSGVTPVAELGLATLARAAPTNWSVMATAVITSVPAVVVVLLAQRATLTAMGRALSPP